MKNHLFPILSLALLAALISHAQTTDDLVTQGRQAWVAGNLNEANSRFAAAVAVSPNHEAANTLHALTRILVLPERPAVKALLDRLGVETQGRNVLRWTASFPTDSDGVPLAPTNLNAQELIGTLRAEALPELAAAAANLAKVTSPGFLLNLTAAETKTDAVTLDLGDIRLLQAGLNFAGYWGQTLNSWNFDAQLAALRASALAGGGTAEQLLMNYPQLLSHSNEADLAAARTEFTRFVENYLLASDLIRSRPIGTIRLFNLDSESDGDEMMFRDRVTVLRESLTTPQPWPDQPDIQVNLSRQFTEGGAPRGWLPDFRDDAVVLGTLPYPALGGITEGWSAARIEHEVINGSERDRGWEIPTVANLNQPTAAGGGLNLLMNTLTGRSYALQQSANFAGWTEVSRFVALGGETTVSLPVNGDEQGFFRLVELEASANDHLAQRVPLAGMDLNIHQRVAYPTHEANEPGARHDSGSVWWEWTAPGAGWLILSDTAGKFPYPTLNVYQGSQFPLTDLAGGFGALHLPVLAGETYLIRAVTHSSLLNPPGPVQFVSVRLQLAPFRPLNDDFSNATPLVGEVVNFNGLLLGGSVEPGEPSSFPLGQTSVWWRWVAPADGRYRMALETSDWRTQLRVFEGGRWTA